ncbi:MAG: sulfatase [Verrucomicrobiae bacterium]|nr:sulfatase [Verrucomicrobiae bacterium]MCP5541702.1 sulfatase [Akkermansiaceae bacterium]MCP5551691.1 sulfatase [Akkermansiaceae bacterium]
MNRRLGALFSGFWLALAPTAPAAERPPNIVLIVADDLGYADLGCYGARDFETPNLDRMAAEGVKLTSFYMAASVCSASRAAMLTGCYPDRIGVTGVFFPTRAKDGKPAGPGKQGLNPDEVTIAEILKQKGYATACFGKWHLGDHPKFLPTRQGFDEYFGIPYSNDMGWWAGKPTDFKKDFPPIPILDAESVIETNPDQRQLIRRYTDHAVRFIREHRDGPFFLYLPHNMPHVPLFVGERFSGSAAYGLYGDVVQELDWSVGVVLRALEAEKIDKRTLVVFTSDNGPWLAMGAHAGKADPLRDGKFTRHEGGHRVPCVLRWPGALKGDRSLDGIVASIDLLPTLAKLAGAAPPEDRKIDGTDVWPYLSGKAKNSPRDTFFYSPWVVRRNAWKLLTPGGYREEFPKPKSTYEPGMVKYDEPRLYNLDTDIGEATSLHNKEEYKALVEQLTKLCADYRAELEAGKRPVGTVE